MTYMKFAGKKTSTVYRPKIQMRSTVSLLSLLWNCTNPQHQPVFIFLPMKAICEALLTKDAFRMRCCHSAEDNKTQVVKD